MDVELQSSELIFCSSGRAPAYVPTLPLPARPRRTETTRRSDLDVLRIGGRGVRGAPSPNPFPSRPANGRSRLRVRRAPRRRESEWRAVAAAHALIASPVRRAAAGPWTPCKGPWLFVRPRDRAFRLLRAIVRGDAPSGERPPAAEPGARGPPCARLLRLTFAGLPSRFKYVILGCALRVTRTSRAPLQSP